MHKLVSICRYLLCKLEKNLTLTNTFKASLITRMCIKINFFYGDPQLSTLGCENSV